MAFECPQCKAKDTLQIVTAVELGAAAAADEAMIQIVECAHCQMQALAVYRESRGGSLQGESQSHRGYPLAPGAMKLLTALLQKCPDRFKRSCSCKAHLELAQRAAQEDWSGFSIKKPFAMKLAERGG